MRAPVCVCLTDHSICIKYKKKKKKKKDNAGSFYTAVESALCWLIFPITLSRQLDLAEHVCSRRSQFEQFRLNKNLKQSVVQDNFSWFRQEPDQPRINEHSYGK